MTYRLIAAALAGFAALSTTAVNATDTSPPATQVVPPSDGQTIVCRQMKITGSRLAKRKICATKLEWSAHDREAEKMAEELAETSKQGPRGN